VQAFSLFCPIFSLLTARVFPAGFIRSLCKKPLWHRHFCRLSTREGRPDLAISQLFSLMAGIANFSVFDDSPV
jgi:hypothetical protein